MGEYMNDGTAEPGMKFVPVYARVEEVDTRVPFFEVLPTDRRWAFNPKGQLVERDGVTGALIGVYELRAVM